jgi:hypothetical protein
MPIENNSQYYLDCTINLFSKFPRQKKNNQLAVVTMDFELSTRTRRLALDCQPIEYRHTIYE